MAIYFLIEEKASEGKHQLNNTGTERKVEISVLCTAFQTETASLVVMAFWYIPNLNYLVYKRLSYQQIYCLINKHLILASPIALHLTLHIPQTRNVLFLHENSTVFVKTSLKTFVRRESSDERGEIKNCGR